MAEIHPRYPGLHRCDDDRWTLGYHLSDPTGPEPVALGRSCRRCKRPTWFAGSRQTIHGEHPLCDPWAWLDHLDAEGERQVEKTVIELLNPSMIWEE